MPFFYLPILSFAFLASPVHFGVAIPRKTALPFIYFPILSSPFPASFFSSFGFSLQLQMAYRRTGTTNPTYSNFPHVAFPQGSNTRFPEIPEPKTTNQKLSIHQHVNSFPLRPVKLAPEVHATSVERFRQAGAPSAIKDFFSCQDCPLADPTWQLPTAIPPHEESAMVDRFRPLATSVVAFFQAVFATVIFQRYDGSSKFPVWSRHSFLNF